MTEFENAYVNAKRILKEFANKPEGLELSVDSLVILEGYRQYVLMCEELEAKGLITLPRVDIQGNEQMKSMDEYNRLLQQASDDLKASEERKSELGSRFRRLYDDEREELRRLERHTELMRLKINHYRQRLWAYKIAYDDGYEQGYIKEVQDAEQEKDPQMVEYIGDGYDPDGNIVYDSAYCPNCQEAFDEGDYYWQNANYCPMCGQALDWGQMRRINGKDLWRL